MSEDIILLTVDSWRYDTVDLVPNLSTRLSEQSDLITTGAATNWVFPSILSGTYYPNAYDDTGDLRSSLLSLPEVLSQNGYETGGFVSCNPYVSKWSNRFDEFWNGGIGEEANDWYSGSMEKWLSRGYRTAFLQKRVSAKAVAQRAQNWYQSQDGPRFLWMHLMEPHLPYYPGIREGIDVGLLRAYHSIVSYQRNHDDTPSKHMQVQRELYNKCVEVFDRTVPSLLDFLDEDAVVVAFGDHGEEFEHGHYDHERLYDECVRVPLFFENIPELRSADPVRQLDIAPAILRHLGIDTPSEWDGQDPVSLNNEPAKMVTPQTDAGLLHTGIRTEDRKLIQSYDQTSSELVRSELFDLDSDPDERNNIDDEDSAQELKQELNDFLADTGSLSDMTAETGIESEAVKARLEDLGYK